MPANFSGEAAIAQSAEFAVPAARGHPDFNFDFGVGRGLGNCADTAKRRKPLIEGRIADKPRRGVRRWNEGASRDGLRGGDACVRKREPRELFTGLRCGVSWANKQSGDKKDSWHNTLHERLLTARDLGSTIEGGGTFIHSSSLFTTVVLATVEEAASECALRSHLTVDFAISHRRSKTLPQRLKPFFRRLYRRAKGLLD